MDASSLRRNVEVVRTHVTENGMVILFRRQLPEQLRHCSDCKNRARKAENVFRCGLGCRPQLKTLFARSAISIWFQQSLRWLVATGGNQKRSLEEQGTYTQHQAEIDQHVKEHDAPDIAVKPEAQRPGQHQRHFG